MRKRNVLKRYPAVFLMLPILITLLIFFLLPIAFLFRESFNLAQPIGPAIVTFTPQNYVKILLDPFYQKVMWNTIWLGLICATLDMIIAYPVAYHLARCSTRLRMVLIMIIMTPMFTALVVRGYMWRVLLSDRGIINSFLLSLGLIGKPIKIMYTMNAVIIGMVHALLPFMILPISSSIQNINPSLEEAAKSLGANPIQTFIKVTLPLSLPGVAAGFLYVFAITVGSFVMPKLLGGPAFMVMGTFIYEQILTIANWPMGAAMAFILLIIAVSVMYLNEKLMRYGAGGT